MGMTIELAMLLATTILAASLWIPYIVGVNTTAYGGDHDTFVRPPDQRLMEPWVHRAHRAHLNMIEQFVPFAVIVLLAHQLGVSNVWTVGCAVAFFVVRAVHAWGMIGGWARFPLRPTLFTLGWVVTVIYAIAVMSNAAWA